MARKRKRAKRQSLFDHAIIREYLSDLELANDVDWMFRRLNNDEWVKRLAVTATEKEANDALRALRTRYSKMERLLSTRLKKKTLPKKKSGRSSAITHARPAPSPQSAFSNWRRGDRLWIQYMLGACFQTDLQPITLLQFLVLDKDDVNAGSTADGNMTSNPDFAGVDFFATLRDEKKWHRFDSRDSFSIHAEAVFELPPAPCDGWLYWGTEITAIVHGWHNNASEDGQVIVHVIGAAVENVDEGFQGSPILFQVFGNLINFAGSSRINLRSPQVQMAGRFPVVKNQRSSIHFLCVVTLGAQGGRVTADNGNIAFRDILGADSPWGQGLRYEFKGFPVKIPS